MNYDFDELRKRVEREYERDIAQAKRERDNSLSSIVVFEGLVKTLNLEEASCHKSSQSKLPYGRLRIEVLNIINEFPDVFTLKQVEEKFQTEKFVAPLRASIESAIYRYYKEGILEKVGVGIFRLKRKSDEQTQQKSSEDKKR